MAKELIYTSAPRGLKPGSTGFTTVATTAGMSRQAVSKLEMLSGYELYYSLSDPKADMNPDNFAHARIELGGEKRSVLSRVAFAGADYSGRTNKIAHHFLLTREELADEGPAWMIAQLAAGGRFKTEWTADPGHPPEPQLRGLSGAVRSRKAWEKLTGDDGWGGALVRAFHRNPRVPAFVIFEPGQDVLSLFARSLAVLPPDERWKVGFATYYTGLPAGVQYHWRGVLAGTAAAKEMGRYPTALTLDLTKPLGAPEADAYTEAARAGRVFRKGLEPATPVGKKSAIEVVEEPLEVGAGVRSARVEPDLLTAARLSPSSAPPTSSLPRHMQSSSSRRNAPKKSMLYPMLVTGLAAALLVALGAGILLRRENDTLRKQETRLQKQVAKLQGEKEQTEAAGTGTDPAPEPGDEPDPPVPTEESEGPTATEPPPEPEKPEGSPKTEPAPTQVAEEGAIPDTATLPIAVPPGEDQTTPHSIDISLLGPLADATTYKPKKAAKLAGAGPKISEWSVGQATEVVQVPSWAIGLMGELDERRVPRSLTIRGPAEGGVGKPVVLELEIVRKDGLNHLVLHEEGGLSPSQEQALPHMVFEVVHKADKKKYRCPMSAPRSVSWTLDIQKADKFSRCFSKSFKYPWPEKLSLRPSKEWKKDGDRWKLYRKQLKDEPSVTVLVKKDVTDTGARVVLDGGTIYKLQSLHKKEVRYLSDSDNLRTIEQLLHKIRGLQDHESPKRTMADLAETINLLNVERFSINFERDGSKVKVGPRRAFVELRKSISEVKRKSDKEGWERTRRRLLMSPEAKVENGKTTFGPSGLKRMERWAALLIEDSKKRLASVQEERRPLMRALEKAFKGVQLTFEDDWGFPVYKITVEVATHGK